MTSNGYGSLSLSLSVLSQNCDCVPSISSVQYVEWSSACVHRGLLVEKTRSIWAKILYICALKYDESRLALMLGFDSISNECWCAVGNTHEKATGRDCVRRVLRYSSFITQTLILETHPHADVFLVFSFQA